MPGTHRPPRRILAAGLGACLAIVAGSGVVAAAPVEQRHGPFAVDAVTLEGLSGMLDVNVVEGDEVSLVVTGPEAALAALAIEAAAGELRVRAPAAGNSVTVVERMTVVTGPGASSNVVIGGTSTSGSAAASPGDAAPIDAVLELPAGTRLAVLGFTGDAAIGDVGAAVRIEAIGGSVQLGAVTDAALTAIGTGRIEAAAVDGDVETRVTGAGRIAVAGGRIDALTVDVTGDGVVTVEAPAATAVVGMIGAGEVRLASVDSPVEINRVGAGQFSVGSP